MKFRSPLTLIRQRNLCIQTTIFFLIFISLTYSECLNACSGHGRCTMYDMCICHRNWQSNDCSERVCPFGKSFTDTPKGDLDGNGKIDDMEELVAVNNFNYPYGTHEIFSLMENSDMAKLSQSAHGYMECSNAGSCDRKTGLCKCYNGFAGTTCNRISCPGEYRECSGHGTCKYINQLAKSDYLNVYNLWDQDISRGCICDYEYFGGDCSQRYCKQGLDPMYLDQARTLRFSTYYFAVLTTSETRDFYDGPSGRGTGYFKLRFYDLFGKPWLTPPIAAGSSCDEIVSALEKIPHNIIPEGFTQCMSTSILNKDPLDNVPSLHYTFYSRYRVYFSGPRSYSVNVDPTIWAANYKSSYDNSKDLTTHNNITGDIYRIEFLGNPGDFFEPEIVTLLSDGSTPSLQSQGGQLMLKTWSDGQHGESYDYFDNPCIGPTVRISQIGDLYFLNAMTSKEKVKLASCLGGSDDDPDNNIDEMNWDYGSISSPHIVRLTRTVADYRDGGFYVVLIYDPDMTGIDECSQDLVQCALDGTFKLLHPFTTFDHRSDVDFDVYTTKGTLQMTNNQSEALFDFASKNIFVTNTSYDLSQTQNYTFDGDISCSNTALSQYSNCIRKNDLFFMFDPINTKYNPPYLNIYKTTRIFRQEFDPLIRNEYSGYSNRLWGERASHRKKNVIVVDKSTNWAQDTSGLAIFRIYKFTPSEESTFRYVAECSNRGTCNYFEGTCDCFPGYGGDACSVHESVIV